MSTGVPTTADQLRVYRSAAAVTLRKQRRHQHLMHKRLNKLASSPGTLLSLDSILQSLSLSSISSIKSLRKFLCSDKVDYISLLQFHPNIVHYLSKGLESSKSELAYEVSWCFANLALGPPMLVNDIRSYKHIFTEIIISGENKALAEQACWVLGNLAADLISIKEDIKCTPGLLKGMVHLLSLSNSSLSTVACWALTNLIRGPIPDTKHFFDAGALVPVLELIHKKYSSQVVESLWLLSFFTCSAPDEIFDQVYDRYHVDIYLKYLEYDDPKILVPVVRILGNAFLMYPYLDYMFNTHNFSNRVAKLIVHENVQVKKESLWMLSNIVTLCYVEALMQYYGDEVIRALVRLISEDIEEVKVEAGIALYNLAEVYGSAFLPRILSRSTIGLFGYFVSNIQNVPAWVKFEIEIRCDVDLLRVSLGFIALCLEINEVSKEIEDYLRSDDIRDAIEDCKLTLEKGQNRYSSSEAYIIQMCEYILKWFPTSEFSFS